MEHDKLDCQVDVAAKGNSNLQSEGLKNVMISAVEEFLSSVSNEAFTKAYKRCYEGFEKKEHVVKTTLSGSSKEAMNYKSQFHDMILKNVTETISQTMLTNVEEKLKELEELKSSQSDHVAFSWRPPGDAFKHMIPFDRVMKLKKQEELEDKVEKVEQDLKLLTMRLINKRSEAKDLLEVINNNLEAIKTCVLNCPEGE